MQRVQTFMRALPPPWPSDTKISPLGATSTSLVSPKRLMAAVRPYGMRVLQQVWHGGHNARPRNGLPPWSASQRPGIWDGVPAIFAEDKHLMTVRMKRLLHPDAWSQRPLWGTNHVVSNVIIEKNSPDGVVARSRFHMMELRRDNVRHFAGSYIHHLKRTGKGFQIALQRVDMTNAQATFDYVLQVWV